MKEQTLPTAIEPERLTLGAVLIDPSRVDDLPPIDDYFDPRNRACREELGDMARIGIEPDAVVLKYRLEARPEFTGANSPAAYLASIGQEFVVTSANFDLHARAVRDAARKREALQVADQLRHSALNGKPITETIAESIAGLVELQDKAVKKTRFNALTAANLDHGEFQLVWLIDFLLVEFQPCILAGPKKSLKTTLLLVLLLSMAVGTEFLGRFTIHGCRKVLLCSGESGLGTLQETARRIAAAIGWALRDIPNFTITPDLPRLNSIEDLAEFERFLVANGAEVVAIDPAYLCIGANDNGNLFAMGEVLLRVSQLCQRLEVTLILCHHTRKNTGRDAFDSPELEDIAWSGFQEFARQWILIGRRERYEPGTGEHRLWLSAGGSAGHGGLWAIDISEGTAQSLDGRFWSATVSSATEAAQRAEQRKAAADGDRAERQLDLDREAACKVLAKVPDGLTKTAIGERAGISNRRWPSVFAHMLELGDLVKCEVTVSNHKRPITGYRLADQEGLNALS